MSNVSPLAVFRPLKTEPYHEATPLSSRTGIFAMAFFGAIAILCAIIGVGADVGAAGKFVAAGRDKTASACTVPVKKVRTPQASARQEAATSSQNCTGSLVFASLVFRLMTICRFY